MKDVPLAEFRANCFVSETVGLSVAGGMIGAGPCELLVYGFSGAVQLTFFPLRMALGIWVLAVLISTIVGLLSAALPSYHASRRDIVDGLRHIGWPCDALPVCRARPEEEWLWLWVGAITCASLPRSVERCNAARLVVAGNQEMDQSCPS